MKETPLLFSDAMALAMVENRKRHTRRLNGLKEMNFLPDDWRLIPDLTAGVYWHIRHVPSQTSKILKCPFGQVGDRIWGREAWRCNSTSSFHKDNFDRVTIEYRARASHGALVKTFERPRGERLPRSDQRDIVWRPSIFMPRWASRIERELVGIQLERLQAITEADARAEGVTPSGVGNDLAHLKYRAGFVYLWNAINAKRGYPFEFNPWVWVLEFGVK